MRRDIVAKKICEFSKPADIILSGSASISKEISEFYRPGYFYIEDTYGMSLPLGIGLAMGTDKRVFLLLSEGDLLRNFGALNQMASSKKQNLFVFLLNNGSYQSCGGFPNIFNNAPSMVSLIFNVGCRSFNLSNDFENKRYTMLKHFIDRGQGPMICMINVDKSKNFDTAPQNNINEFLTFVRDTSILTALYNPFSEAFNIENYDRDAGDVPILRSQE